MARFRVRECPRCRKPRRDGSPVEYVWWIVKGHGLMCWACWGKIRVAFHKEHGNA